MAVVSHPRSPGEQPGGTAQGTEAPAGTTLHDSACLELADHPDAVPAGRRFVAAQARARGMPQYVEDAVLVVGEFLANARQHAKPPVTLCVDSHADVLRVEVRDGSLLMPVRGTRSLSNMTGRGLALVEALANRWGVAPGPRDGKTVWAEFASGHHGGAEREAFLEEWDAPATEEAEQRFTVVLGDVPTDFLLEAKAHVDNLVREFTLEEAAVGATEIPEHYRRLIETVVHGFSDARQAIKRQALAAAARGEQRTRLVLQLPASTADAGEAYLAALDEADTYARAARLLTLETPPDHRLFRRWYVEAVIEQLRDLAAGRRPGRIVPFEERLVGEIRRLSSAQRIGERAARLLRVTAALARTRTPEDVAAVVIFEGVEALGASGGSLVVPAGDGEHVAVPGAVGYENVLVDALREERLDAPLPAATALRTGTAVWLESREERDREFPALRGFESATISMCAVPLVAADRVLGALRFSFSVRKIFDDDERAFVQALAAQTAQTLQRTESYQTERDAALKLQRALLPDEVPEIDGWTIATFYRPAGDQEAGGDFYDVVQFRDGSFAAIVGDVMGRGLEAAASMAQIRATIRAYAVEDADPVSVFERVDDFFRALALPQLVTALYLLVDPIKGMVTICSAGHLAPLVVDDKGTRLLPTVIGPPFGLADTSRAALSLRLRSGAAIVAITDGLVERRGEDIDDGIERVVEAASGLPGDDAAALLRRITAIPAVQTADEDDVTVLVVRRD